MDHFRATRSQAASSGNPSNSSNQDRRSILPPMDTSKENSPVPRQPNPSFSALTTQSSAKPSFYDSLPSFTHRPSSSEVTYNGSYPSHIARLNGHPSVAPLPGPIQPSSRHTPSPIVPVRSRPASPENSASYQKKERLGHSRSPTAASLRLGLSNQESGKSPQSVDIPRQVTRLVSSMVHNATRRESESELSDPDSNLSLSPPIGQNGDEITVKHQLHGAEALTPTSQTSPKDSIMTEAPPTTGNSYPKRKRNQIYDVLAGESVAPIPNTNLDADTARATFAHPNSGTRGKGVMLGHWADSDAPESVGKHAVLGFIDCTGRFRGKILVVNCNGTIIADRYPLPSGAGGTWAKFESIVFFDHLAGVDQYVIKEFVRIRADGLDEPDEATRIAAEKVALQAAFRRVEDNPELMSNHDQESKRHRASGTFMSINPATSNVPPLRTPAASNRTSPLLPTQNPADPLPGTRPTRVLLGCWKGSDEAEDRDRHAIYGIVSQNDMFRVKVVRESRDGRYIDGNFPSGAGGLWVNYEDVDFEPHLSVLSRAEMKEYCRIRQWQVDHGEAQDDRVDNEKIAVRDAQLRVSSAGARFGSNLGTPLLLRPLASTEEPRVYSQSNGRVPFPAQLAQPQMPHNLVPDVRAARSTVPDYEVPASVRVLPDRADALGRREIVRTEDSQSREDQYASDRSRAAALAAADAVNAATAYSASLIAKPPQAPPHPAYSGQRCLTYHEREDVHRRNNVWARQEAPRPPIISQEYKVYDGIKYSRKSTGPFTGKLVSQGSIINIDGEDYVEYRVLTKPAFF